MPTPKPLELVPTRTLTAEAAAAAALALIQHPAVWEALQCLALITETIEARRHQGMQSVGQAVCDLIDEVEISDVDANRAVQLLTTLDSTARTWATVAYSTTRTFAPA